MIADGSTDQYSISGADAIRRVAPATRPKADAGRGQIDAVAVAAADNFGIAGNHRDTAVACRGRQGMNDPAQQRNFQSFFKEDVECQVMRLRAADREIVYRAMNRQRTNIAARKLQWLYGEAVGGHHQFLIGRCG